MEERKAQDGAKPVVDVNGNGVEDFREPKVIGGILTRYVAKHPHTLLARGIQAVRGFFGP